MLPTTTVWCEEPGKTRRLLHTIQSGSTFTNTRTRDLNLMRKEDRQTLAQRLISGWKRSGAHSPRTIYTVED